MPPKLEIVASAGEPEAMTPEHAAQLSLLVGSYVIGGELANKWRELERLNGDRQFFRPEYGAIYGNLVVRQESPVNAVFIGESPELAKLHDIAANQITIIEGSYGREYVSNVPLNLWSKRTLGKMGLFGAGVATAVGVERLDSLPLWQDTGLGIVGLAGLAWWAHRDRKRWRNRQADSVVEYIDKVKKDYEAQAVTLNAGTYHVARSKLLPVLQQCDTDWARHMGFVEHPRLSKSQLIKSARLLLEEDTIEGIVNSHRIRAALKAYKSHPNKQTKRTLRRAALIKSITDVSIGNLYPKMLELDAESKELWWEVLEPSARKVAELQASAAVKESEVQSAKQRSDFTGTEKFKGEIAGLRAEARDINAKVVATALAILPEVSQRYAEQQQVRKLDSLLGEQRQILEASITMADSELNHASAETLRVFRDVLFEAAQKVDSTNETDVAQLRSVSEYITSIANLLTSSDQAEQFYKGLLAKNTDKVSLPAWDEVADRFAIAALYEV